MSCKYNAVGKYVAICLSSEKKEDKGGFTVVEAELAVKSGTIVSKGAEVTDEIQVGDKVFFLEDVAIPIEPQKTMIVIQDGIMAKESGQEGDVDGG